MRSALSLAKSRGKYCGDPEVVMPEDFDPAPDDREARSLTRDEPRKASVTYEVEGVERTLTEWSQASGISKATLHHRLAKGLSMGEAVALGRGVRGKALVIAAKPTRKDQQRRSRVERAKKDCRTGAANTVDSGHTIDTPETKRPRAAKPATL